MTELEESPGYPFPPFHDMSAGKGGLGKRRQDAQHHLPASSHLDLKDPSVEGGRRQTRLVTESCKHRLVKRVASYWITSCWGWWEKSVVEIGSSWKQWGQDGSQISRGNSVYSPHLPLLHNQFLAILDKSGFSLTLRLGSWGWVGPFGERDALYLPWQDSLFNQLFGDWGPSQLALLVGWRSYFQDVMTVNNEG